MTLPVSLAAAAVTLRASANCRQLVASVSGGGTLHMHMVSDGEIAVADLIVGMLAEHYPLWDAAEVGVPADCAVCDYTLPCRSLALLVPLVRAFLPDWTPDTEETP